MTFLASEGRSGQLPARVLGDESSSSRACEQRICVETWLGLQLASIISG
jgi:hypothetical protein